METKPRPRQTVTDDTGKGEPRFAAVYIRVSTDDQIELSPESQMEEIGKYARREGIVILREHIYTDPGISGKKAEKRPGFMRMIAAAKEKDHPFSVILLWKYSRFARNQEESIFYKSILRSKCGVEVISVTEPLIAGPFGSLIERIIEWMDEFYSIRLSQEVKRSMRVNAEHGVLQSAPSFGYRVEEGRLVPVGEEARLVRHIFDSFNSGKALMAIAKELNAMGIRTHRGNPFENRTVEYILRNPVYIGRLRWNPTGRTRRDYFNENIIVAEAGHEPLITMEQWEAAQERMDRVKAQWGPRARPASELKGWTSGIVRCGACGATLVFSKPHYYKCNNYAKGRCTQAQHIRADTLEEAVITRLRQDAAASDRLDVSITRFRDHGDGEAERLEAVMRQLRQRRARLQEAYLAGVLSLDDFASAKAGIESDMEQTASGLAALSERTDGVAAMAALREEITLALEMTVPPEATVEEQNRAARSVIESCVFDKTACTLSVTYRFAV